MFERKSCLDMPWKSFRSLAHPMANDWKYEACARKSLGGLDGGEREMR